MRYKYWLYQRAIAKINSNNRVERMVFSVPTIKDKVVVIMGASNPIRPTKQMD
jgi:hypothetical protein